MSNYVDQSVLKSLYSSLIYPHLTYAIELWGASARTQLNSLRSLQNRSVKYLRNYPTEPLNSVYTNNRLFKLEQIHHFYTTIKFFKYLDDDRFFLNTKLQSSQTYHTHNTRFTYNNNFRMSSIGVSRYYSSFYYQSIKFYNDLPIAIRESYNIYSFNPL